MTEAIDDFSEYVAARQNALIRTAYLLTGEYHNAEDLVQAALARAYLSWGRIRDKGSADAYVRRTMVNEYTSWWRRAWRRREHVTATLPDQPTVEPDHDDRDELWQLVGTLPPKQRAVIVLRYYEDLGEAQTAELLGCSRGTVKSQTNRALAKLRAGLANASEASTYRAAKEATS